MIQELPQKSSCATRARNELRQQVRLTIRQSRANVPHDLEMFNVRIRRASFTRNAHALTNERRQRRLDLGVEQRESLFDVPRQTRNAVAQVIPVAGVERRESKKLRR